VTLALFINVLIIIIILLLSIAVCIDFQHFANYTPFCGSFPHGLFRIPQFHILPTPDKYENNSPECSI